MNNEPLGHRRPQPFPPVVLGLLVINGAFYLLQNFMPNVVFSLALWPAGTPEVIQTSQGLARVPQFHIWQLLSYGFLHGGPSHLLFNMFGLWMFGSSLEHLWGSRRFALFYVVCVIGAGVVQLITVSMDGGMPYPTVGASGGVYGILLGFGMMFPNRMIMLLFPPIPMKAKYFVIVFGGIELFLGVTGTRSGVAHFAHLGGMLFGFFFIVYWHNKLKQAGYKKPF